MGNTYFMDKEADKKLSAHFKVREFACKDGSNNVIIEDDLIELLEAIRCAILKPIEVVSGYRTKSYNQKCGGAENSFHIKGMAADIKAAGISPTKLGIWAAMCGATGVGIYKDWVHIDVRKERYVWET